MAMLPLQRMGKQAPQIRFLSNSADSTVLERGLQENLSQNLLYQASLSRSVVALIALRFRTTDLMWILCSDFRELRTRYVALCLLQPDAANFLGPACAAIHATPGEQHTDLVAENRPEETC